MWITLIILWIILLFVWQNIDNTLLLYYDEINEKWEKVDKNIEKEYETKSKRNYYFWLILIIIWILLLFF